jgi:hypothetical protein
MALLSGSALVSYLGAASLPFLVALYAEERLRLRPDATGVPLVGFGLVGLVLGTVWGRVMGRRGAGGGGRPGRWSRRDWWAGSG